MMKTIRKRLIALSLIAGLLLFPGCTENAEEKAPSNYAQLHSLLGKSTDDVCQALGIDKAQVDLAIAGKAVPPSLGEAQYAGLTWEAVPYFGYDGYFYGFYYIVHYTENPDQAAPDFMNVIAALAEDYGQPEHSNDTIFFDKELNAKNLLETVWSRKSCFVEQYWGLDHEITPAIRDYEKQYLSRLPAPSEGEDWATAGLKYDLCVFYRGGLDSATITMDYRLTTRQEYIGPSREERLEAQSKNQEGN
jgi:hypothetical protein